MPSSRESSMPVSQSSWQAFMGQTQLPVLVPPRWARGSHLQTLLGHLLPSNTQTLQGERVIVDLPDGDKLAGSYYEGTRPILVYAFHGLGGSTQADYMKRTLDLCTRRGYHVLMMNHRGCGSGRGLARHPYHSGRGEDLAAVFAHGRQRFPQFNHIAVGFSLSGNALLLLLSGQRGDTLPDGAIAVNAPINLAHAAVWMRRGLNRIYQARFVIKCQRAIKQRREDGLLTVSCSLPPWISLEEVDRRYTAPAGGFRDPADYYQTCSTQNHLAAIKTPTVLLTAGDDPFVPASDYAQAQISPMVYRHIEPHGGHMGYLTRDQHPVFGRRWLDQALDHYLDHLCQWVPNQPATT